MSTKYMKYEDWADWAGDHHEEAEAELRREREAELRRRYQALKAEFDATQTPKSHEERLAEILKDMAEESCEHAEVDNQGVCENCGSEVEGWEPDEQQLDQHHGTSVAA